MRLVIENVAFCRISNLSDLFNFGEYAYYICFVSCVNEPRILGLLSDFIPVMLAGIKLMQSVAKCGLRRNNNNALNLLYNVRYLVHLAEKMNSCK